MPKRIPVSAVKKLANELELEQVVVLAWDGESKHVVTYGKSVEDCDQAAQAGDWIKTQLEWPDTQFPSRVKKLKARIDRLERDLAEIYQVAGVALTSKRINWSDKDAVQVLDNILAALNDESVPHTDLLPWPKQKKTVVKSF